jgi:basic membrane protein A
MKRMMLIATILAAAGLASPASAFSVCQVTDTGGIDDNSFNQTAWQGVEDAREQLGITARFLESQAETDYEANLNSFLDGDCDLIITVGFLLGEATQTAAEANPDQMFSIVDFAYDPTIPNVLGQVYATDQAAFLSWLSGRRHDRDRRCRHLRWHQHSTGDHLHGRVCLGH